MPRFVRCDSLAGRVSFLPSLSLRRPVGQRRIGLDLCFISFAEGAACVAPVGVVNSNHGRAKMWLEKGEGLPNNITATYLPQRDARYPFSGKTR